METREELRARMSGVAKARWAKMDAFHRSQAMMHVSMGRAKMSAELRSLVGQHAAERSSER